VIEDFKKFDVPQVPDLNGDPVFEQAVNMANKLMFPDEKWNPVHYADTRYYKWNLATSAEAPFTSDLDLKARIQAAHQRGDLPDSRINKRNVFNHAYVLLRTLVHQIKYGDRNVGISTPATAHARSHLVQSDEDDKVRMVFGMPWLSLIIEVMFFWPYFAWLRKGKSALLWGYETMTGGLYRLLLSVKSSHMTYIMVDWKQFDKRLPYWLTRRFFKEVRERIDFERYQPTVDYPEGKPTSANGLHRLFDWMYRFYHNHVTRLPDGSLWRRKYAGEASGNLVTQIIDSWCNLVVLITVLLKLDIPLNFDGSDTIKVLGDDSFIALLYWIHDLDNFKVRFKETSAELFGFVLNEKKSRFTRSESEIEVLGYGNDNGLPKPNLDKLVAQAVYPERRVDAPRIKARVLGLAYAACGMLPDFHEACRLVFERFQDEKADIAGSEFLRLIVEQGYVIDLDRFPSIQELQSKLYSCTMPDLSSDYWPTHVFKKSL